MRGEEWKLHPGHGHPARLGPTEPSAVVSPGLFWGGEQAWRRRGRSGLQRERGERPGRAPGRAGRGSAGDDNAGDLRAGLPAVGTASSGEAGVGC